MSSAEHERLLRRARAQDVALFRYRLIGSALEEGLSTRQRGKVVRGLAGQVHAGPGGRGVQVSRNTIDRWIRAWRAGGFEALLPSDRKCEPVTAQSVLAMAAALKRENPERTAAQVRRIMVAQAGDAPSERTLQRHFAREDLATPRGTTVFGRFEAGAPNVLWVAGVLHGPLIGGGRPTWSRSWTITRGSSPGTGGGGARTRCTWPWRSSGRSPREACRPWPTSITGRAFPMRRSR